jgi:hypothetical protein
MSADGSSKNNYTFHGSFETKGSNSGKSEPQEIELDFLPPGTAKVMEMNVSCLDKTIDRKCNGEIC